MEGNKRTDIKLRRIFSLFDLRQYKPLIIVVPLILLLSIYHFVKGNITLDTDIPAFILAVLISIVIAASFSPKRIVLYDDCAEFYDYVYLPPRVGIRHGFPPLKVHYTVCEIKKIEFHQNRVEKIFNVGHISFSGKVFVEAKRDLDRIEIDQPFYIYGIPNFEEFRKEYEN